MSRTSSCAAPVLARPLIDRRPTRGNGVADADESDAGIASAINNAVARVAALVGVSLVGVVVAGTLLGDTFAPNDESVRAFHEVVLVCAALVAAGGIAGILGITNPRRVVEAERCSGRSAVRSPGTGRRARSGFHGHNRTSPIAAGLIKDPQIHGTIEQLVAEEHELWEPRVGRERERGRSATLDELKVSLDQCWDLLRQRRALREAGSGPGRGRRHAGRRWSSTTSSSIGMRR